MKFQELNIDSFHGFIKSENLLNQEDNVLIGVSGGVDSMVLLHLLHQSNFQISVAHVNYQLRAENSDADEELVKQTCKELNVPFYQKKVTISDEGEESFQMKARMVRYDFFEESCEKNKFSKIALAHHVNDLAETLMLHFIKGATLFGMKGIPLKRGKVVRPLLSFSKNQIEKYAADNSVPFREDESNSKNTYQRNFVRNEIIPKLEVINPGFLKTTWESRERFRADQRLMQNYIEALKREYSQYTKQGLCIKKELLEHSGSAIQLLFYLTQDFDLPYSLCSEVIKVISSSEAKFETECYRIQMRKDDVLISQKQKQKQHNFSIAITEETESVQLFDLDLNFTKNENSEIVPDKQVIQIDQAKIQFPLTLRPWKHGDRISPLGMKGRSKKVSDILIDKKLTVFEKNKVTVLCNANGDLLWILEIIQSELFKITGQTKSSLEVRIK